MYPLGTCCMLRIWHAWLGVGSVRAETIGQVPLRGDSHSCAGMTVFPCCETQQTAPSAIMGLAIWQRCVRMLSTPALGKRTVLRHVPRPNRIGPLLRAASSPLHTRTNQPRHARRICARTSPPRASVEPIWLWAVGGAEAGVHAHAMCALVTTPEISGRAGKS